MLEYIDLKRFTATRTYRVHSQGLVSVWVACTAIQPRALDDGGDAFHLVSTVRTMRIQVGNHRSVSFFFVILIFSYVSIIVIIVSSTVVISSCKSSLTCIVLDNTFRMLTIQAVFRAPRNSFAAAAAIDVTNPFVARFSPTNVFDPRLTIRVSNMAI